MLMSFRRFTTSRIVFASFAPGSHNCLTIASPLQAVAAAQANRLHKAKQPTQLNNDAKVSLTSSIASVFAATGVLHQKSFTTTRGQLSNSDKIIRRMPRLLGNRNMIAESLQEVEMFQKYASMSKGKKKSMVPETRGENVDPKSFLTAIGRKCGELADKFEDWADLFTVSSTEMSKRGISAQQRKYILSWREMFKRGRELEALEKPARQKKHLKLQKAVKDARKHRQGLA